MIVALLPGTAWSAAVVPLVMALSIWGTLDAGKPADVTAAVTLFGKLVLSLPLYIAR